jgi:hypothetical protein
MKFWNEFWLILFREYISPKLFAVQMVLECSGFQVAGQMILQKVVVYTYCIDCFFLRFGGRMPLFLFIFHIDNIHSLYRLCLIGWTSGC